MEDIFNLRKTCNKLAKQIDSRLIRTLWSRKKRESERMFLNNRIDLLRGMRIAEIQTNRKTVGIRFNGNLDPLIVALKENRRLSLDMAFMNGTYDDSKLRKLKKYEMLNLRIIMGENLWQVTKQGTTESIIVIPRQIGHDHWCKKHEAFHSYLLVELVLYNINEGTRDALLECEETAYRDSRLFPIFATATTLRKMLDAIDMWEGIIYEQGEGWPIRQRNMYLPQLRCF